MTKCIEVYFKYFEPMVTGFTHRDQSLLFILNHFGVTYYNFLDNIIYIYKLSLIVIIIVLINYKKFKVILLLLLLV